MRPILLLNKLKLHTLSNKNFSFQEYLRLIFLGIIILFSASNSFKAFQYTFSLLKTLPQILSRPSPGKQFQNLRKYLKNIPLAGFYSDQTSPKPDKDAKIMQNYQEAQFALSPTILDYFNSLNYEFIILSCANNASAHVIARRLHTTPIVNLSNGIMLVQKNLR